MTAEKRTTGSALPGSVTKEVASAEIRTSHPLQSPGQGLRINSMTAGESIVVTTRNSSYRLVLLDPIEQKVVIRGGKHFPQPTEAYLLGSSEQGQIYVGWVVPGQGLGIGLGSRCVLTSPVVRIEREHETAGAAKGGVREWVHSLR